MSHHERKHCSKFDKFNEPGNILIADQFNNRAIEISPGGKIVWFFGLGPLDFSANSVMGINDAVRIPGGQTLMTGTGIPAGVTVEAPLGKVDNRVLIVNKNKQIVWQYGQFGLTGSGPNLLNTPVQASYIPCNCGKRCHNFSILITDQGNNRIIRVSKKGDIIWQYPGINTNPSDQLNSPNSAEKLKNGNYLIADENNNRVLEINPSCNIVVKVFTLGACAFASRLENGDTLLTDAGNNRIVQVSPSDVPVWQYITNAEFNSIPAPAPTRAVRLKDNSTLISDQFNNRVIRVSQDNVITAFYGLPLSGAVIPPANIIGTNKGYSDQSTQFGLYAPYSAYLINC
jgi:hypothetical protein